MIAETWAEELFIGFAGVAGIGVTIALFVALGALLHRDTRAIVWGPFIHIYKVSAPLGGTITAALLFVIGTMFAGALVHGYVERYTGDFSVVSGDGRTYTEPSFYSAVCGNPRAIGKPLDCSSTVCETSDTISGRWVRVKRRDPAQLDCWANFGSLKHQHGLIVSKLGFDGSTEEEQRTAIETSRPGFIVETRARVEAGDAELMVRSAREAREAQVLFEPAVADALEQAEQRNLYGQLVATIGDATTAPGKVGAAIVRARALTAPVEKRELHRVELAWYVERRVELFKSHKPAKGASEAVAAFLQLARAYGADASAIDRAACTSATVALKADLEALSRTDAATAWAALSTLESQAGPALASCGLDKSLLPGERRALRSSAIAQLSRRIASLQLRDEAAAHAIACDAERLAGDGVVVPPPNVSTFELRAKQKITSSLRSLLTLPKQQWEGKATEILQTEGTTYTSLRGRIEELAPGAILGAPSIVVSECGAKATATVPWAKGAATLAMLTAELERSGPSYIVRRATVGAP